MSLPRAVIVAPPAHDAACGSGSASVMVRGGDFLFLSGLTSVDRTSGELLRGTTAAETRQILTNLQTLLASAGSSLDKVVKVHVLLHDMLEAPNMNEVYADFFSEPPPARTVCGVCLPAGVKVMIECTALA